MKERMPQDYGVSYLSHQHDKLEAIIDESTDSQNRRVVLAKWQGLPAYKSTWELDWRFTKVELDSWESEKQRLEAIERFADDDNEDTIRNGKHSSEDDDSSQVVEHSSPKGSLVTSNGSPGCRTSIRARNNIRNRGRPRLLVEPGDDGEETKGAAEMLLLLHAADTVHLAHFEHATPGMVDTPNAQAAAATTRSSIYEHASDSYYGTKARCEGASMTDHTENELACAATLTWLRYAMEGSSIT